MHPPLEQVRNYMACHAIMTYHSAFKTTTILIDGKRVKLQLWDTSGQGKFLISSRTVIVVLLDLICSCAGRFCTIIRSYSRGAQGILLVYDITNKWSFEGMDRWVKEVEEHAPGIPKVLVGNRLHLAFNRQVKNSKSNNNNHIVRSSRRMLSDMPSVITWASMKCHPLSTSTSRRAFRSFAEWRFAGMGWRGSGEEGRSEDGHFCTFLAVTLLLYFSFVVYLNFCFR